MSFTFDQRKGLRTNHYTYSVSWPKTRADKKKRNFCHSETNKDTLLGTHGFCWDLIVAIKYELLILSDIFHKEKTHENSHRGCLSG